MLPFLLETLHKYREDTLLSMTRRFGGRRLALIAGLVVVALIVAFIAIRYDWFGGSTVKATNMPIGVNVDVTGTKVPKALAATKAKGVKLPVKSVTSLGPIVDVTPGGELEAPMTMRFKLNRKVSPDATVFVASRDKPGDEWKYQQVKVSTNGRYASIQRTHLSWFWPFEIDFEELFREVEQGLLDTLTGGLTEVAGKPVCERATSARKDGYNVESKGDALYWCFGIEKGERTLKITNRLRYPLEVEHPGFKLESAGTIQLELKQLARIGSGPRPILFPFDTAVYTTKLKQGDDARIDTQYSAHAQRLHRFEVAVRAIIGMRAKLGGKGLDAWSVADSLLEATDCYNAVFERSIGKVLSACFVINQLVKVLGPWGVLVEAFIEAGTLLNWLLSEFDVRLDQRTGRANYTVLVTRDSPADRFIGDWRVHGGHVVFRLNGTGYETWNYGPCSPDYNSEPTMCTAKSNLKWRMEGGKLVYTVTSFKVEDEFGRPPFDIGRDGEVVGESFTVTYLARGFIKRMAHNDQFQHSNPYLCGKGVSEANDRLCGA